MITVEEQLELFNQLHNMNLFDLYCDIKNDCEKSNIPLLNNENDNSINEFIELIMNNVDLKKINIKYYKKRNLI